jgi:hypothetical protein
VSGIQFEVFMAVKIHTVAFWVITSCRLAGSYQSLESNTASIFRVEVGQDGKVTKVCHGE